MASLIIFKTYLTARAEGGFYLTKGYRRVIKDGASQARQLVFVFDLSIGIIYYLFIVGMWLYKSTSKCMEVQPWSTSYARTLSSQYSNFVIRSGGWFLLSEILERHWMSWIGNKKTRFYSVSSDFSLKKASSVVDFVQNAHMFAICSMRTTFPETARCIQPGKWCTHSVFMARAKLLAAGLTSR